jgi:hypothetical protein
MSTQRCRVLLKTQGKCFYCGFDLHNTRDWIFLNEDRSTVLDHKVPKARDGDDHDDNLAASCLNCNGKKGKATVDEYRLICGLRAGTLSYSFPFEAPRKKRDWLCVHSSEFEKLIVLKSIPGASARYKAPWRHYGRGAPWKARRR